MFFLQFRELSLFSDKPKIALLDFKADTSITLFLLYDSFITIIAHVNISTDAANRVDCKLGRSMKAAKKTYRISQVRMIECESLNTTNQLWRHMKDSLEQLK